MKIAINTLYETPGKATGGETYLINTIKHLTLLDKENEYYLFASKNNKTIYQQNQENFIILDNFISNEKRILRIICENILIPYYCKKLNIDILFSTGSALPLLVPCKSVVVIQNILSFYKKTKVLKNIYRRLMIFNSLKNANKIIAVSNFLKTKLIEKFNCYENKIDVVYEGVNIDHFNPQNINYYEMSEILSKYNIKNNYLLYVSALWAHKNAEKLIKAYKVLIEKYGVDNNLVVVGEGDKIYEHKIKNLIKDLNLKKYVILTGFIERKKLKYFYKNALVFVYPSSIESFGLPPLEAMAMGVPVVAANKTAVPEIVGDAGILVDPDNIKELSEAIYSLISNVSLRNKYIKKGKDRIKYFSWLNTARKTIEIFKDVYNNGYKQ